ncbi:hypothetical protein RM572_00755 [Streptomyces sp. DSM 42041]|uniref:Uncharacterized protein n=1 Tax=Streptomyces hazeniae TaxID=3075538 RepID=A0ABU2NKL0_9ACTN|nr:hypothetical protein [Streptomyces sp. DSM 42041]MDT0377305.1 hypothetical protein [Streptomyces sp. DSM 42041]
MNGPAHYREAERLARRAQSINDPACALVDAQLATAYATLAQAAATAMAASVDQEPETGMPPADVDAWFEVCGTKRPTVPDPAAEPGYGDYADAIPE